MSEFRVSPPTYPNHPRGIIFANSELGNPLAIRALLKADDLIIAADGGSKHCLALGIQPHLLIGDLDSIDEPAITQLELSGTEVIRHPIRKDFTDLELALLYTRQRGIKEVLVVAALGLRWDQTLANLLLPAEEIFSDMHIRMIDGFQEIQLLRGVGQCELSGLPGDIVSLVPLGGNACGITTQGLEYPLQEEDLLFGSTRGISNVLLDQSAIVFLRQGLLLIVLIRSN